MTLTRTIMMANTNRRWMNPPIVVLVTSPSAHKTRRMIAMVVNIRRISVRVHFKRVAVAEPRRSRHAGWSVSGFLNVVAGMFDVLTDAVDGPAACAG
jgi:hypothetical protein